MRRFLVGLTLLLAFSTTTSQAAVPAAAPTASSVSNALVRKQAAEIIKQFKQLQESIRPDLSRRELKETAQATKALRGDIAQYLKQTGKVDEERIQAELDLVVFALVSDGDLEEAKKLAASAQASFRTLHFGFHQEREDERTFSACGLEWQAGPDEDMNYRTAQEWVKSLGKDWQAPTTAQLEQLFKASQSLPCFKNAKPYIWTKRSKAENKLSCISFRSGNLFAVSSAAHKRFRALAIYNPRVSTRHWEWKAGPNRHMTYDEAQKWIESLGDGWKTPAARHLVEMLKSNTTMPFAKGREIFLWSTARPSTPQAWCVPLDAPKIDSQPANRWHGGRAMAVRYIP